MDHVGVGCHLCDHLVHVLVVMNPIHRFTTRRGSCGVRVVIKEGVLEIGCLLVLIGHEMVGYDMTCTCGVHVVIGVLEGYWIDRECVGV